MSLEESRSRGLCRGEVLFREAVALWLFRGLSRTGLCIFPGAVFGLEELCYRSIRITHLPSLNVCDVTHPTNVTLVHYKKGFIYTLTFTVLLFIMQ